ncbi:DUF3006 domain-containing protein [Haladaptatus sp. NG-WS-4]
MADECSESAQTYTAVLDRFEGDLAVLLLESDGETVDELIMDQDELPESGRHQDAIFTITIDEETVEKIQYRPTETEDRTTDAQKRFDRLARRPSNDDEDS